MSFFKSSFATNGPFGSADIEFTDFIMTGLQATSEKAPEPALDNKEGAESTPLFVEYLNPSSSSSTAAVPDKFSSPFGISLSFEEFGNCPANACQANHAFRKQDITNDDDRTCTREPIGLTRVNSFIEGDVVEAIPVACPLSTEALVKIVKESVHEMKSSPRMPEFFFSTPGCVLPAMSNFPTSCMEHEDLGQSGCGNGDNSFLFELCMPEFEPLTLDSKNFSDPKEFPRKSSRVLSLCDDEINCRSDSIRGAVYKPLNSCFDMGSSLPAPNVGHETVSLSPGKAFSFCAICKHLNHVRRIICENCGAKKLPPQQRIVVKKGRKAKPRAPSLYAIRQMKKRMDSAASEDMEKAQPRERMLEATRQAVLAAFVSG